MVELKTYVTTGCVAENNLAETWKNYFIFKGNVLTFEESCSTHVSVLSANAHVDELHYLLLRNIETYNCLREHNSCQIT